MRSTKRELINVFILSFSIFIVTIFLINANNLKKVEKFEDSDVEIKDILKEDTQSESENKLENENDFLYKSFITLHNDLHKSTIISLKTGNIIEFNDLLKEECITKFWDKVYELLEYKYPKFITDVLKKEKGNIYYTVKENEFIIYFEKFVFEPEYIETISIKVNYNEVYSFLNFEPKLDNEYLNESAYDYNKNKKTIALTFDDGPGKYTNDIVNILKDNKAKATFFMVGSKMNNYKNSLMNVYNNNFEIGSHTYSHMNMKKNNIKDIKKELKKTNDIFYNITGANISLVRPPYGAYNDEVINNIDYPLITWNIDTNDWRYHDKNYIVNHILDNAQDGSIILMHDSYKTTVEAVKEVLPKLYTLGYQVVTVSDLAAIKGQIISKNNVYSYFK